MSSRPLSWTVRAVCWLAAMAGCLAVQSENFRKAVSDGLPAATPLAVLDHVRSSLECASLCRGRFRSTCHSYGYSRVSRTCYLFPSNHCGNYTQEEGADYFAVKTVPIGDPCTTKHNCICNAECRYGTCQCVAGYFFYPGNGTCLEECPDGYGDGYYAVVDKGMRGNNIAPCMYNFTEKQCWQACVDVAECSSFEWGYRNQSQNCCIQNGTAVRSPADYLTYAGWLYCQRDCA